MGFLSPCNLQHGHAAQQPPSSLVCLPGLWNGPWGCACPRLSHLTELCKEKRPSSKDGYSRQRKGPAFPCKDHTLQKSCTEEVFAATSSQQREHEHSDVFFQIQMKRCLAITSPCWASPAFNLLQYNELCQVQPWVKEPSGAALVCGWLVSGGTWRRHSCRWDHDMAEQCKKSTVPWGSSNNKKPFESRGWWWLGYNLLVLAKQGSYAVLHCIPSSRGEG